MHRQLALSIAVLLLCSPSTPASAATIVTECGQLVSGRARLAGDLDCSAYDGDAIVLDRGPLKLEGFTVTAHSDHSGISCHDADLPPTGGVDLGKCKIIGPGLVTGGESGIRATRMGLRDVDVSGSTVGVAPRRLTMKGGTISGCSLAGILTWSGITKHRVKGAEISGNGTGIWAGGCIGCGNFKLKNSMIVDNVGNGIVTTTPKWTIRASTLTGNGLDPGSPQCADVVPPVGEAPGCGDIRSTAPPRIDAASVCDKSVDTATGDSWGICTLD